MYMNNYGKVCMTGILIVSLYRIGFIFRSAEHVFSTAERLFRSAEYKNRIAEQKSDACPQQITNGYPHQFTTGILRN